MPAVETDCLHQKAVLWEATGYYDNEGVATVSGTPVEISVRHINTRDETVNNRGVTVAIDTTLIVDRDITDGSILWLGKMIDLPSPLSNLKQVVTVRTTPDIKGREMRRVVQTIRASDTLPTTE